MAETVEQADQRLGVVVAGVAQIDAVFQRVAGEFEQAAGEQAAPVDALLVALGEADLDNRCLDQYLTPCRVEQVVQIVLDLLVNGASGMQRNQPAFRVDRERRSRWRRAAVVFIERAGGRRATDQKLQVTFELLPEVMTRTAFDAGI